MILVLGSYRAILRNFGYQVSGIVLRYPISDIVQLILHRQEWTNTAIPVSTVGHSEYLIVLTSHQYHSVIAIHYCHTSMLFPFMAYRISDIGIGIGYPILHYKNIEYRYWVRI